MGKIVIPLASLGDRKAHRSWYKLMGRGKEGEEKEAGGEIDLQLRWAHNEKRERPVVHLTEAQSLVPLPGEGTSLAGELRQRNELLVTLVGAKNLPVMDKAMLYGEGSTDPVVTLEVVGVGKVGLPASRVLPGASTAITFSARALLITLSNVKFQNGDI